MLGLRRSSGPLTFLGPLALAILLGSVALGVGHAVRPNRPAELRLVHLLLSERFTTGRLVGQRTWQPCAVLDTAALIPPTRCGEAIDPTSRHGRQIESTARSLRDSPLSVSSVLQYQASALLELRSGASTAAALHRAIEYLEQAHHLAPDDPGVLNDLSVARIAMGERTQQLTPMLRALDAIERAVAVDSPRPEILFNHALILQRLYLIARAERAWARYLAVERDPRWRAEAERHAARLVRAGGTAAWDTALLRSPPPMRDAAARAQVDARVAEAPQKAREFSFRLLGAWGTAVGTGDEEQADRLLDLAREIGAAAERHDTDRSVALAVRAIDSLAADPDRLALLARGHAALGEGYRLFYAADYPRADRTLQHAETNLRAAGSPMHRWADFYRAAAEVELGWFDRANRRLSEAAAAAGPLEPALAGKAVAALGVNHVRQGEYEDASRFYRQAEPYLARAREPENHGSTAYLLAESLNLAGQLNAGQAEALRGLRLLSPFRTSNFLNNHLSTVAAYARNDGLRHAAVAVMGEVLEIAQGLQKGDVLARAYRAHARDLIALGWHDAARADLDQALRWADRLPDGPGRDRTRADVLLVQAQLLRTRDPRAALALLSQVAATYRSVNIQLHIPVALYEAGMAAEAAGDSASARKSLGEAIEWLDRQQESFRSPEVRATFHETVENVFDAMIRIELAAGRPAAAFAYLERARASIQPGAGGERARGDRPAQVGIEELGRRLPADMLFVDYALLDDRISIWTASRQGWRHHSVTVSRDSVAALAKRFVQEAESTSARAVDVRARLFDLLLRPLAAELAGVRRITVVPDRELYQVPFAALWNRTTRRYVVQDHQVTVVPSASFYVAAAALGPPRRTDASALVVGNPRLGSDAPPQLEPLPHAAREASAIATLYPRNHVLTGGDATRRAVLDQLSAYSIFHFAGHAVFNGEQPGFSYLALAPDSTAGDGSLHAREIGELRPSNVRVVVLSACSTLSPRPSRAGATSGLAYSFLRAGVPATVSTMWDVVDGHTGPLLVEFHRRFAAGATAAEALRQAQVQALQSTHPELRAPGAWAAFIYTGP